MASDFTALIEQAGSIYKKNFPATTTFERAVFFSWYCSIRDCAFCFMSVNPGRYTRQAVRHPASILAEVLLTRALGWELGFFSGGIGAYTSRDFLPLLREITAVYGQPIWLNAGPVARPLLDQYAPYLKGVVGSIETINPEVHRKICPSKPVEPYEQMFRSATEMGLKKAITIIIGVGETRSDLPALIEFIENHQIGKIHLYSLVPQQGTIFQKTSPPPAEEQAWWIAQLRIRFPRLDIQAGIWKDRMDRISLLLRAGANSISKFPALRLFGTRTAQQLEAQAALAGRELRGTLTELPETDWSAEIRALDLSDRRKQQLELRLRYYLAKMEKNLKAAPALQSP